MKEVIKTENKSRAINCTFRFKELNTQDNNKWILSKYNRIQELKESLNTARENVRSIENILKEEEKEFKMLEPLVILEFPIKEIEWESQEVNTIINNSTDYRNTNI